MKTWRCFFLEKGETLGLKLWLNRVVWALLIIIPASGKRAAGLLKINILHWEDTYFVLPVSLLKGKLSQEASKICQWLAEGLTAVQLLLWAAGAPSLSSPLADIPLLSLLFNLCSCKSSIMLLWISEPAALMNLSGLKKGLPALVSPHSELHFLVVMTWMRGRHLVLAKRETWRKRRGIGYFCILIMTLI